MRFGYLEPMRALIVAAALLLSACVSTEMRRYVGQDISELFIAYGRPEAVFDLPDGRRAFQYRRGEGDVVIPGQTRTNLTGYANWATVTTTSTPSAVMHDEGCLLTFIAAPSGSSWRVVETRVPRQLVC